ncbi:PilZ domain-containing protein [Desulfobaculum sp. SPO524]|uniref:PilZ domain-containing protein n=1 Tax=Desulfobaculum sp. SPO524 TaxID=3378071 RepID=UPI003852933E
MNTGEFSSVATRIRGYIRRMDSASSLPMLNEHIVPNAPEELDLSGANLQEPLVNFLESINSKLDALLGIIGQERLETEFDHTIEVVELSGAGLAFTCDASFTPGDSLEFALLLGQFPLRVAAAVGNVVQKRHHENGAPIWAVDFTSVRESDQEAIVRFVFREQRERIRERKWSE